MGLGDFFRRLFGEPDTGCNVEELARRLRVGAEELRAMQPAYREFSIPKRAGGTRKIAAPDDKLKSVQRRILRRLLARLKRHPAAMGFERGRSIVTNARPHADKAVVVRMDLKDFFPATTAKRVRDYFRKIGWSREASELLVKLCTRDGGLPQGAPTSPALSNLVNYRLDARLAGLAKKFGATYTRYADDLTFSFASGKPIARTAISPRTGEKMTLSAPSDAAATIHAVIARTRHIVGKEGYELHMKKKLHIRRRHQRQVVTGLVVNDGPPRLPRATRRWLRAVEHHLASGREATLSEAQLAGWRALEAMIATQRA
jgi:hypothetical protein